MIIEQDIFDLGYSKIDDSTKKHGKHEITYYRHEEENRNYSISLSDDGLLTVHFPLNLVEKQKGLTNETEIEKFANWHNNY